MGIFRKKTERTYMGLNREALEWGIKKLDELRGDAMLTGAECDACRMAIAIMREVADRMKDGKKTRRSFDRAALKRVLSYVRPHRPALAATLLCAAVSVAAQLLIPIFCGQAIDALTDWQHVDFARVGQMALFVGIATGACALAQWALSACSNHVAFCVSAKMRSETFRKLQRLPVLRHRARQRGQTGRQHPQGRQRGQHSLQDSFLPHTNHPPSPLPPSGK
jgi:ABC-type bacteriocin/lantibiotic exporter with double-glycine peptidase domain